MTFLVHVRLRWIALWIDVSQNGNESKMIPRTMFKDMNEAADFWRENGFNVIAMNGKIPVEGYKQFFDKQIPIGVHNYWKKVGLFNNGIAIINGRLWNHERRKHMFGHTVDCDTEPATKLICNVNGVQCTPEEMTKKGIVAEYHKGTPSKYHFIVFSEEEFKNLAPNDSGVEVKGSGKLTTVTPTLADDGTNREFVGDSLKAFEQCINHAEFRYHINDRLKTVGIEYLNGNGKASGYKNPARILIETTDGKVFEGSRNRNLHAYACHVLRKYWDKKQVPEIKQMITDTNQTRCLPSLDNPEVESIWNSAYNFVYQVIIKDGNGNGEAKDERTKIQIAFDTVKQQARNLFIDEYKIPHLAIPIADHLEIFPVNSSSFKNWYRMFVFERDGIVLDNQTINDTCSLASAYAASPKYGAQTNLSLRIASPNKTEWYYDLTNKNWEFIKITPSGWDIVKDQVIFRRYSNQQAQVYPDRNYQPDIFDRFIKLVNVNPNDNDTILLLKCYIISLFVPEIQKVILILYGPQGSAKSSLEELIKILVDPSIVKTLTFPTDLNELIQQLSHNHVTYYDNVSTIREWISDQLCRAVSGSGSSKRQLYTDDDDIIRSFKRCIGINGINLAATKADLLDRSILAKLEEIDKSKRRTPQEIWQEFEQLRPQLLGYIFDILVKVLQYEESNPDEKFKLNRMTEFSKYGEIIARCMGYPKEEFIEAYERNRQIQVDEIVESSQLAAVMMCMMFQKYADLLEWDGTPSTLLGEIKSIAETDVWNLNIDTKDRYFPKRANSLSRRLNELAPTLKEKGLQVIHYQEGHERTRKIKIRKISSASFSSSADAKSCSNIVQNADDIADDIV